MAKKSSVPPVSPVSPAEHDGNFGLGLFVGVVAGAFGMFLFGTKQGHTLLQQIKDDLEDQARDRNLPVDKAESLIASAAQQVQSEMAKLPDEFPKFKRRVAD